MNRRNFFQQMTLAAGAPLVASAAAPATAPAIQPWFAEAGLGLFIHWGPSSVGEIEIGWGMFKGHGGKENTYWPTEKYRALADRFDPQNYDPDKWLAAAARAGFRYAVFTARHCDGYAMWPSQFGNFSTRTKMHGRDLVKPYVDACRKHGLKVGFYYIPTDWSFCPKGWPWAGFPRADKDFASSNPGRSLGIPKYVDMPLPKLQEYLEEFQAYLKGQLHELLTNYGKIDLIWWDGYDWPWPLNFRGEEITSWVRKLQPEIVQNDRYVAWRGTKNLGDYNTDLEARNPTTRPSSRIWEQCDIICGGWSYRGEAASCKPASYIIERLARDRAWGGNYLPDFGPLPDGTMPPAFYAICDEMEAWMKHSGVSVLGNVTSGPFPKGEDVPITCKGDTWYLHFIDPKPVACTLYSLRKIKSARMLRTGDAATWKSAGGEIVLLPPASRKPGIDEVMEVVWA
jgi:alpha-L-fucosidase